MRRFAIVFSKFPIDKASVRAGTNSEEVVIACRCINVGLFVSGNLRRDVSVSIIALENSDSATVISFTGSTLRRVSPDERSISFFLLKAMNIARELKSGHQRKLDNGIVIEKSTLESLLEQWSSTSLYSASSDVDEWPRSRIALEDGVFLYTFELNIEKGLLLPSFSSPERFILEINLLADRSLQDS